MATADHLNDLRVRGPLGHVPPSPPRTTRAGPGDCECSPEVGLQRFPQKYRTLIGSCLCRGLRTSFRVKIRLELRTQRQKRLSLGKRARAA